MRILPDIVHSYLHVLPPHITIGADETSTWIETNGRRSSLWVLERASRLPPNLAAAIPRGWVGLVVGHGIPPEERHQLERAGIDWWDVDDRFNESPARRHGEAGDPDSATAHRRRQSERTLGPSGKRAAQLMLTEDAPSVWSVTGLAERARLSVGQSHNVLALLENEGLLTTTGRGAAKRRVLSSKADLLDWLRRTESLLRPPRGAFAFLYARTQREVAIKLDSAAHRSGVDYAVTSSFGALMQGVPTTNDTVLRVRVASGDLDTAIMRLDVEDMPSREGSNLELWEDVGELGTFDSTVIDGIRVAPAARVWLDLMRQGGRYADGAAPLRSRVLD